MLKNTDDYDRRLRRISWRLICLVVTELEAILIHFLHNIMTKQLGLLHQILSAQKLVPKNPLETLSEVMHEHVRFSIPSFLAPREHARGEYGRYPTRSIGPVASRPIDQDHIPIHFVDVVGQVVEAQLTLREQKVLDGPALVSYLLLSRGHQILHLLHLGRVVDVVGVDFGMQFFDVGGVVAILVDENCTAVVVESFPEKRLVSEAENEKIARRRAFAEDVGDRFELGVRHVERVVGSGCVVEERIDYGRRQCSGVET